MAIDLREGGSGFDSLLAHYGHEIECAAYGSPAVNTAIECITCGEVLVDFDRPAKPEDIRDHADCDLTAYVTETVAYEATYDTQFHTVGIKLGGWELGPGNEIEIRCAEHGVELSGGDIQWEGEWEGA